MSIQKVRDVHEGKFDEVKLLLCGALDLFSLLVTECVHLQQTVAETVTNRINFQAEKGIAEKDTHLLQQ